MVKFLLLKITKENWRFKIPVRMRGSEGKQMFLPPTLGKSVGTTHVFRESMTRSDQVETSVEHDPRRFK